MKGQGSVVLLLGGLQKEQRCLLLRIIIGPGGRAGSISLAVYSEWRQAFLLLVWEALHS